ncbi:MAG: 50S ribosomal protein L21 [candidate division Zixibacteria bacterium]
MYALFQLSGFQYRAEEGASIEVPRQSAATGEKIELNEVLLVSKDDEPLVGTPFVEGASIEAEVLSHDQADKVEIYKYKRRTKYRRRQGHRQDFTRIKINKIVTP